MHDLWRNASSRVEGPVAVSGWVVGRDGGPTLTEQVDAAAAASRSRPASVVVVVGVKTGKSGSDAAGGSMPVAVAPVWVTNRMVSRGMRMPGRCVTEHQCVAMVLSVSQ